MIHFNSSIDHEGHQGGLQERDVTARTWLATGKIFSPIDKKPQFIDDHVDLC